MFLRGQADAAYLQPRLRTPRTLPAHAATGRAIDGEADPHMLAGLLLEGAALPDPDFSASGAATRSRNGDAACCSIA